MLTEEKFSIKFANGVPVCCVSVTVFVFFRVSSSFRERALNAQYFCGAK